jgi:hypothetical protein
VIRIICSETDAGVAANVGGPVTVTYKTFVVDIAQLEEWLKEPTAKKWTYTERRVHGIELISGPGE